MKKRKYHNYKTRNSIKKYIIGFGIFMTLIIGFIITTTYINSRPYVKVGDYYFTKAEYNYFYQLTINSMINDYGGSIEGVDFEKDLDKQYMEDGTSWHDYFIGLTDDYLYDVLTTMQIIKNNNELDYDISDAFNEVMEITNQMAAQEGLDLATYLRYSYDKNLTVQSFEKCAEYDIIANKYLADTSEKMLTDELYNKHYEENKNDYNEVKFYYVEFSDDDQHQNLKDANELLENIKTVEDVEKLENATLKEIVGVNNCDSLYSEWLFSNNEENKKVFEAYDKRSVCLIYKLSQEKVNEVTKSIRYLEITKTDETTDIAFKNAQNEIIKLYEESDKSVEKLEEIAESYADNGTLYEEKTAMKHFLPPDASKWLFDKNTKPKEYKTFMLDNDNVFCLIYFIDNGEDQYKAMSKTKIQQGLIDKMLEEAQVTYAYEK